MYLQNYLEYRGDLLVYSLSNLITPLLGLGLWVSVSGIEALAYSKSDIVSYFLLVTWINSFTVAWTSYFLCEDIRRGDFSKFLVKPLSAFSDRILLILSEKIYKQSFVTLVVVAGFYFFFIDAFARIQLTVLSVFLFVISLLMSFLIAFLLDFSIGMSAVWLHEVDFLKNHYGLVDDLLSGRIIPLKFLPSSLMGVAAVLPFRYTLSFPAEILLGRLDTYELIFGVAMQSFWLVAAFLIYKLVNNFAVRSYQSYGS